MLTEALLVAAGAVAALPSTPVQDKDIVEVLSESGQFKTLVKVVQDAGLADTLKAKGPYTVFAPTDEAFAKVPKDQLETLVQDKEALRKVLTYHVAAGSLDAKSVSGMKMIETVQGASVRVMTEAGSVKLDGATVVKADIQASNGTIHAINAVLMPRKDIVETAVGAGQFGTLVGAIKEAGLADTLMGKGPFTVFAPNDAAFQAVPKEQLDALVKDKAALKKVLAYHVVPGSVLSSDIKGENGKDTTTKVKTVQGAELTITRKADGTVMVNGARVIQADVLAGNGVIHVINSVLMPQ
ncbi:MAG: fasciclin domain-containing protein [Planctomycetota bacterium]|nr:MAG: fasciclin domain-containing protein [Planctomycetota bacterium]